jgi:DNA repair/transcription protein MET18/MMS19
LNIANYPTFLLLPYKQDVVLGIQPALDDHKRLVRNTAVETRLKWFVVGTMEEEASKK